MSGFNREKSRKNEISFFNRALLRFHTFRRDKIVINKIVQEALTFHITDSATRVAVGGGPLLPAGPSHTTPYTPRPAIPSVNHREDK